MRIGWFGSLRVRITVLATLAVAVALALVSGVLVWSVERSVIGQVRDEALTEVNRVAGALEAGEERPASGAGGIRVSRVTVFVLDEDGEVVDTDVFARAPRVRIADDELDPDVLRAVEIDGFPFERVGALLDDAAALAGSRNSAGAMVVIRHGEELVVASRTVTTPEGVREVIAVSPLAPAAQSVDAMISALAVGAPVLIVFVAALTWVAVSRSLRGVEQIRERADAISHSSLGERLPEPRSAHELHQLTATLNEMLARLEEGARRQREFISDASHELHTPLAAMRAELEIALAHAGEADWPQVATRLLSDHDRLERLTSDLLALARLDDGPSPPAGAPVDLAEVAAAELQSATLTVDANLEPALVMLSASEAARLVRNLIENTERHGRDRFAVRVASRDGEAVLVVEDDGPGVPAGERERIFERFTRLDDSRGRDSGGMGLGLALVHRIVESHGGWVAVTDSRLGGARFEVHLPAL